MLRVFISYARGDAEEPFNPDRSFVLRLFRDLSARGFDVWLDRVSMPSRQLTFSQEIRDAIVQADRLLLVVGPAAMQSEYVRKEWRFALDRADKTVTPILRMGDYSLPPEELRALHCEDFRDDARYELHLENLVRQLRELPPPLGRLINLPPLPAHYIERPADVSSLTEAFGSAVGLSGMGGIGKSVMAGAVVRDHRVRRAFPDGIVWVSLGTHPDVIALQQTLHRQLGGDGAIASVQEGRQKLTDRLRDKRLLLVLDDAWQRADVEAFTALGSCLNLLVTTRDRGLLASMGISDRNIETLTPAEARRLLAGHTGDSVGDLPSEADEVIRRCSGLPLAIALCGGMVRGGEQWSDVVESLRERELEMIRDDHPAEAKHRTIEMTLELSIEALEEEQQRRFAELAAFPGEVPEEAVLVLWSHTGGLRARYARKLLRQFARRSLLQIGTKSDAGAIVVSRHDLLRDFSIRLARQRVGDDAALHDLVVEAYRAVTSAGWWSAPNDGYFFSHLADHLARSGRVDELAELLHQLEWLETKNENGQTYDILRDFTAALRVLPESDSRSGRLRLIGKAFQRDVHFIAHNSKTYPQALFQCLWNSCWWESASGLTSLLETWRGHRERRTPGFSWLRSLLPAPWPVASALIRKLPADAAVYHAYAFTFAPSDRLLAFTGERGTYVFDAESGADAGFLEGQDFYGPHLAFSRDEQFLYGVGYVDHDRSAPEAWEVRTWSIDDGIGVHRMPLGGVVKSFARDRAGDYIALGLLDGSVRIVRLEDANPWVVVAGDGEPPTCLAFSGDGSRLAAAYADGTLVIVDRQGAVVERRRIASACEQMAFVRDTRILAAAAGDILSLWDLDSGVRLNEFSLQVRPYRCAFSADGSRLACASSGSSVRTWTTETGQALSEFGELHDVVWDVALSSNGSRLAYGTQEANKLLVADGSAYDDLSGRYLLPGRLAIAPDDSEIFLGEENGNLSTFNTRSGVLASLAGFDADVDRILLSEDGRWLLTGCGIISPFSNGVSFMWLWSNGDGWRMNDWPDIQQVWRPSFSANGSFLAAIDEDDAAVHVWNLDETTELRLPSPGPNKHVAAALSCDGSVVSALDDGTITSRSRPEPLRYPGRVTAIACSPDGRTVAAAGDHGVGIWSADSPEMIVLNNEPSERCELNISQDGILTARGEQQLFRWRLAGMQLVQAVNAAFQVTVRGEAAVLRHPTPLTEVDLSRSGALLAGFDDERHLMVLAVEGHAGSSSSSVPSD
jgi:WD40 repeat protein